MLRKIITGLSTKSIAARSKIDTSRSNIVLQFRQRPCRADQGTANMKERAASELQRGVHSSGDPDSRCARAKVRQAVAKVHKLTLSSNSDIRKAEEAGQTRMH